MKVEVREAKLRALNGEYEGRLSACDISMKELAVRVASTESEAGRLESQANRLREDMKEAERDARIAQETCTMLQGRLTAEAESFEEESEVLRQRVTGELSAHFI